VGIETVIVRVIGEIEGRPSYIGEPQTADIQTRSDEARTSPFTTAFTLLKI